MINHYGYIFCRRSNSGWLVHLYPFKILIICFFFFSSRRRHTRYWRDWSSDVCSSDLNPAAVAAGAVATWLGTFKCCALPAFFSLLGLGGTTATLFARWLAPGLALLSAGIGRGSWRGRVEISGVAGSLKKKKNVYRYVT